MKVRDVAQHRALRGVAIGGCIANTKPLADAAHAHFAADPYHGWVCIAEIGDMNPTTLIHELAHILRRNGRHDEAWKAAVRELGGRVERRYLRKAH